MTDKQPTALFLAEQMEDGRWQGMNDLLAAAELRRLYKENEALRTALAQPEKTDMQIGITYEEANPPEPYCKRCGKKLGTEAHDVHTCTPKEIQPVAWVDSLNGARPDCVTDFKYLSVAQIERKEHLQYIALYTATQKKEWVGLTDEEIEEGQKQSWVDRQAFESAVWWAEEKLKEKNCD